MQINFKVFQKGYSLICILFFVWIAPLTKSYSQSGRWGMGVGTGYLPDYPAAAQNRMRYLIFPVYRGTFFRIDRVTGVSGEVYNDSRIDFSWNFIFQFPTQSKDIPIRSNMPDLDWVLSIGPELKYILHRGPYHKFFFRFPIRQNTCTNFASRTRFCGIAFNPGFRHTHWSSNWGEWTYRVEAFADSSEYQQYFFEVNPSYATTQRPSFHARSGFLGFVYGVMHTLPFENWELSTALNYYDYSLAINRNSPLFQQTNNWAVFLAVTFNI